MSLEQEPFIIGQNIQNEVERTNRNQLLFGLTNAVTIALLYITRELSGLPQETGIYFDLVTISIVSSRSVGHILKLKIEQHELNKQAQKASIRVYSRLGGLLGLSTEPNYSHIKPAS